MFEKNNGVSILGDSCTCGVQCDNKSSQAKNINVKANKKPK